MDERTIDALAAAVAERIFVPVEASGRHVHVTADQARVLFGHPLTPERPLSQPGQFLANERVTIQGPKGQFENVAVLGPERKEAQVEISLTDARTLGITVPVRLSGDVKDTPGITLVTDRNRLELRQGCLAAQRHIHLTPKDAAHFGVADKQIVSVKLDTARPVILGDTVVRVSDKFALAMHIDTDECNAAAAFGEVFGEIVK